MARAHYGMTLVELLVVLTILALLTTVAVTSTDVMLGQGRYEATTRTLREIQDAALGPAGTRQTDGTLVVSGFVADMGRLPVVAGSDPRYGLAELWAMPPGAAPFALREATYDPEVKVASGWRGPYLRLPIGKDEIRDGWGNALDFMDADGNPVGLNQRIEMIGSRGSDGVLNESEFSDYRKDLAVRLCDRLTVAVGGNVYLLENGQQVNPPDPGQVHVMLYGPDPNNGGLAEIPIETTESDDGVVSYAATTTSGVRYVRAYYGTMPGARKSQIARVEQGQVIHLEIR